MIPRISIPAAVATVLFLSSAGTIIDAARASEEPPPEQATPGGLASPEAMEKSESPKNQEAPPNPDTATNPEAPANPETPKNPEAPANPEPPSQSYSLFLPSSYTTDRLWPILFCFDPGKRGMVPIELFREAAERLGFIIVSSNSFSASESTEKAVDAMVALWNDATARLPIDLNRIYATGWSGGGRLCWILASSSPDIHLAGIIEAGAGFPWKEWPAQLDASRLAYYGLVGEIDFNYDEMQRVAGVLREKGIPARLVSFEGPHGWPDASLCGAALEWLQIEAMRRGGLAADSTLVNRVFAREMATGVKDVEEGRLIEARDTFGALVATFSGLRDVEPAREKLSVLEGSPELAEQIETRRREAEWGATAVARAIFVLDRFEQTVGEAPLPRAGELATELELGLLQRQARSEEREESLAARRVLENIHVRAASTMPRRLMSSEDYDAAAIVLEVAASIKPEEADTWRRLAQAQCRAGKKSKALDALGEAIRLGYSDLDAIAADPSFESIRGEPSFQALVRR